MKLKNPIVFFILFAFIVVNIIDAITAFFILPGEANPIYILTKSIYVVILLKLLLIWGGIIYYRRGIFANYLSYYMYIVIFALATVVIGFAAYGNIYGMQHPEIIEETSDISDNEKVKYYFSVMSIIYYMPVVILIGLFVLYNKSLKYVKIDEEFYKKRKWWRI